MSRPVMNGCGTRAAYARGCRCPACNKANNDYHHHGPGLRMGIPKIASYPDPSSWITQGACAGMDTELWFCEDRGGTYQEARAICWTCPVRTDCLQWALNTYTDQGMWGGLSPKERKLIRSDQPAPPQQPLRAIGMHA